MTHRWLRAAQRGPVRWLLAFGCACAIALLAAGCVATFSTSGSVTGGPVTVETSAGPVDALFYQPDGKGRWPAVLVWTDGSGLRPAYVAIGRRLAAQGYVVLIPNAYHRSVKLDGVTELPALAPSQARERGAGWRAALTEEALVTDIRAYMAFLDAQPAADAGRKVGTLGFDYGSINAFFAARAMPERIAAVAVLYPTGTATTRPTSPHLFVGESRAAYYVALATNDDRREPGDKGDYREAFANAGLDATVEVLPADHGFAVPGADAFDQPAAETAWARVLALLEDRLD